ncbi:periplasmic solute-binding component of iron(III) ABC transporter [Azotobacter vinelandii CA]|uniref:Periplasmic solute-binding component of iron(III) ABC transporter n=2 Tax=Azotobacter vinelandii TaxID=354 RepID=C1DE19_AZOVD|nr:ABC transporter substrate-binding protein [Azotobacter vinelandii]ACO80127.1 periplasmic solute-binding component of iron(III) ABC transporter [Azotobacter vinelandii DJ]AGK16102.1 periplasmic solute-binding component of iron(III) ABC transporter [Azotobacter vinelandii CA]AGK21715.1 periplasmic solute-binding component of iron(III) ABC transporter [Azotobacter vinelandii CA6]SFX20248.1 iron complex transport system substrate-binding protein [Azotobacter vinelandii]GLK62072.1 iron ABC trans
MKVIALLTATLLLCACDEPAAPVPDGRRQVTDMAGRSVPVAERVESIACLEVLCYERLFLLGASERIAMMIRTNAPWMLQTNPAVARIQQLGSDPDTEELLRRHVDVAFHTYGYPAPGKIKRLADMGIPTLVSQPVGPIDSVEAFVESRNRMLRLYGQVLGPDYAARAEEWCAYHLRMVAMVRERTARIPAAERIRLFHVRGPAATDTQGTTSNTYWYGVIAGADMVIGRTPLAGRGGVSLEALLEWNPQVVNIGRQYSARLVTEDPRWSRIAAVRNGRVRELPEGVFYWDGSSEGVLLMLYLAKELYPQLFADLDLRREIRDYYRRFYRYALSDRELDLMLQGKGPDGRRHNDMNN